MTWQLQQAKTRLSEVIEEAHTRGPQVIARHGAERAVVLSIDDYRALVAHKPNFVEYLLGCPEVEDFEIEYSRDTGQEIGLWADRSLICSTRIWSAKLASLCLTLA